MAATTTTTAVGIKPLVSINKGMLWVFSTVVLAMIAYYFIGVDEGMSSVFGKTMVVHEFVHDARHFLGFPCH